MITIHEADSSDIEAMVSLSKEKRLRYEKAQPQFWRYAKNAETVQHKWFEELLKNDKYLMLTAKDTHQTILGFIIGQCINAPAVYDPGGLTLMVDDFCVKANAWDFVGQKLIEAIKVHAKTKGVSQILVVCGNHDDPKRNFLIEQDLSIASEWFVGKIE